MMVENDRRRDAEIVKLITLNTWGGRIRGPLRRFMREYSPSVDIFCLQEVFNNKKRFSLLSLKGFDTTLFSKLTVMLKDHQGLYCEEEENGEGEAIFIRSNLAVTDAGERFMHRWKNAGKDDPRKPGRALQYVQFQKDGQQFTVAHMHGLYDLRGKIDTEERITQSRKVRDFLDSFSGVKILCGDFNLLLNTQSLEILGHNMRNLVTEYAIASTRSKLHTKPEKHADYVFISPEVELVNFRTIPVTVSDHLPLFLEFK